MYPKNNDDLPSTPSETPTAKGDCACAPAAASGGSPCCGEPQVIVPGAIRPLGTIALRPLGVGESRGAPQWTAVSSMLHWTDRMGAFKARWGIGRMAYTVKPGLYAIGKPDQDDEVLVTANYKLTFDKLRSALPGRNLWILVLDTVGINVWCAAGKGTFGTGELVNRIALTRLSEVVNHRRLIVPQLGAPGVAAHEVKEKSGFKVIYGPIRCDDLPAFLDAGRKATPKMRQKLFPLSERVVLIPVELVAAFKAIALLVPVFLLASLFGGGEGYTHNLLHTGVLAGTMLFAALIGGAVLTPMLLPLLPGRAFSTKSLPVGLLLAGLVWRWLGPSAAGWAGRLETGAWFLMVPAIAAFLAMNFTGASTYTSLSGVRKEMRRAVPLQIGAAAIGLVLWIGSRFAA